MPPQVGEPLGPVNPNQSGEPGPSPSWIRGRWLGLPAVFLLLTVHFVLALSAVWHKSNTFDEPVHMMSGYTYWKTGGYRFDLEAGVLTTRVISLPLLLGDCSLPSPDHRAWRGDGNALACQFLFGEPGNDAAVMLRLSRSLMALVSVAFGLAIYLWSRRLFGPEGGILSLALYAFCPVFLANGPLAAGDMIPSLFFLLALWAYGALLQKVSPFTLLAGSLATAGLLMSKMSAVLVLPMLLALLVIRLIDGRSLALRFGKSVEISSRWRRAAVLAGATLVLALAVYALIWAAYGFRYSASNPAAPMGSRFELPWEIVLRNPGSVTTGVEFARDHRLLPEAYLFGFASTFNRLLGGGGFMNGHYSVTGWWSFFPYAFAVKTPIPIFVVVLLAAVAAARGWVSEKAAGRASLPRAAWEAFLRTAPLWVLLAVYWGFAVTSTKNIGVRHVLPTYGPMLVLAGAAGLWLRGKGRVIRIVLAAVVVALVVEVAAVWPNYLAYFNAFAGGPSNGYRHLVDSSLDWGQDLPALKDWLGRQLPRERAGTTVYLSYFGASSPDYWGVKAERLPGFIDVDMGLHHSVFVNLPLKPGIYCVSASLVEACPYTPGAWRISYETKYQDLLAQARVFLDADAQTRDALVRNRGQEYWGQLLWQCSKWTGARMYSFLRHRAPDDSAGHSILIYRVGEEEIRRIQYGPPFELILNADEIAP